MAICDQNIVPIVFSEEIATENIKKKYGLFPINDVKPVVEVCTEIFNGPTYNTNLTKLETGLTESSVGVFNITDSDLIAQFNFTGNTDTLTAYTGYFEYQIYSRALDFIPPDNNQLQGINNAPPQIFNITYTITASTPYSAITVTPYILNQNLTFDKIDQEYILNSNNKFIKNNCLFKGEVYVEPNLGYTYEDSSWYFVTLVDPTIPTLGPFGPIVEQKPDNLTVRETTSPTNKATYVFAVPTRNVETDSCNCNLINETLTISPIDGSVFSISNTPEPNTLLVVVNGITLSDSDYTISADTIIKLTKSLSPTKDIITASYLKCDTSLGSIYSEQYQILSAITSGPTSAVTTSDKVYFNTEQNKYEYYLDYTPGDAESDMSLFLNGVKLTYGLDYYMSTSVENRVIFDSIVLAVSDIIYVVYSSNGILEGDYNIVTSSNSLEWRVTPTTVNDRLNGSFLVEITESSNTSFTTGLTTGITVNYVNNETDYGISIPSILEGNKSYIWRVNSEKVYSGILDNIFITRSVSRIGKFTTNNEINSY